MNFKRLALQTAAIAAVVAAVALFASGLRPAAPAGVLLGAALSLWKTRQYTLLLQCLAGNRRAGVLHGVLYGFSLLLIGGTMVACILADIWLFGGVCAGVLLPLPAMIAQTLRSAKGVG